MELRGQYAETKKMRTFGWMRWLVAAVVVFQTSAALGAQLSPPETLIAIPRPPRAASGR